MTRLQSLGLDLRKGGLMRQQRGFSAHTLDGTHLQQLTQLTSLSLKFEGTRNSSPATSGLVSSIAAMPQLRSLGLMYDSQTGAGDVASALWSALPSLSALTSLDFDAPERSDIDLDDTVEQLQGIEAALPPLQHVGLPADVDIIDCAHALSGLTALTSLRLHTLDTDQDPQAAQLLSRLTRLQVWRWELGDLEPPASRASWLSRLREVAVESCVHLPVIAHLSPDVCISLRQNLASLGHQSEWLSNAMQKPHSKRCVMQSLGCSTAPQSRTAGVSWMLVISSLSTVLQSSRSLRLCLVWWRWGWMSCHTWRAGGSNACSCLRTLNRTCLSWHRQHWVWGCVRSLSRSAGGT